MFEVDCFFMEKLITYIPTKQELKNAIERAITDGITIVCNNQ